MRLPLLLVLALASGRLVHAQVPAAAQSRGATVTGYVRDSIARAPLAGATVQLVAADGQATAARTAIADSAGRYGITDVPDGRYALGFFHPMLDSLGLQSPMREVMVSGHQLARADLSTPSPARMRGAICGPRSEADTTAAILVGTVRDAGTGAPLSGAAVAADWMEMTFGPKGPERRQPHLVATTAENGWFAICNVPRGGTMSVLATRGADSTDRLEVQLPSEGFERRELYLGAARTVAAAAPASSPRTDSLPPIARVVRTGNGRLAGTVVTATGSRPLAGAQVAIMGGPATRTNERGEWALVDAPAGTRMLEVRAVSYYPERRQVNVVPDAPSVRVALTTLKAMLDTVRVTARGLRYTRDRAGFAQRAKGGGIGSFITPEQIARRSPMVTSDLFRSVSALHLEHSTEGPSKVLIRSDYGGWCAPTVYLDGAPMPAMDLTVDEIDDWVKPSEIAGIEVYPAGAPPQFQPALSGCGSIVIWKK